MYLNALVLRQKFLPSAALRTHEVVNQLSDLAGDAGNSRNWRSFWLFSLQFASRLLKRHFIVEHQHSCTSVTAVSTEHCEFETISELSDDNEYPSTLDAPQPDDVDDEASAAGQQLAPTGINDSES